MPCNKPRRTPSHPKKSHIVKACFNGKEKIIRFGQQGKKSELYQERQENPKQVSQQE